MYRYRIYCCVQSPEGRYLTTIAVSGIHEALLVAKLATSLPMLERVKP